jgi:type IV pilus assembly protein PilE
MPHSPSALIRRTEQGFTLIELMIVVAVIGILSAIAYPSYKESIAKSRRADMQRALADADQYMRRYYSSNDTFAGASLPAALAKSPKEGNASYTIAVSNTSTSAFTLTASPTGTMSGDKCGTLAINQSGTPTQTSATASVADCFKSF